MSESVHVQKLLFRGLIGAWFAVGGLAGQQSAKAAGPFGSSVTKLTSERLTAQASDAAPDVEGAGVDGSVEEEVPFSELNEALTAARSRLTELTKAAEIAKVAGELREQLQIIESENRQLKSVLSQLQTDNDKLIQSEQAANRRIAELEKTAQESTAEAKRLDEELVTMRWQNSELSTSLTSAETLASESAEELAKVREDLGGRAESLEVTAEQSAGEIARLQRELDAAREATLVVERSQAVRETELAELRKTAEETQSDTDRLARDLDATITDLGDTQSKLVATETALDDANIALEASEQEVGVLRTQLTGDRAQSNELQQKLETAETELETTRSLNVGLERQVDVLKAAAGEATDAARQNLLAVENQINEINAALASVAVQGTDPTTIAPAGGPVEFGGSTAQPVIASENGDDDWLPRPSPPRATATRQLIAATSPTALDQLEPGQATPGQQAPEQANPARNVASQTVPDPEAVQGSPYAAAAIEPAAAPDAATVDDEQASPAVDLAALTSDNPEADADALIEALNAKRDTRGLTMTVPGALLFAVNSDQIEPSAHDALSSVAQLANIYDNREILIIGHTDAVGDASYNQELSERRAELVKSFFVEEFEIDAERLKIEGQGEQSPITSNATADGRNTNRRVEVVILN